MTEDAVREWCAFARSVGATHVLSLLGPDELARYAVDPSVTLAAEGLSLTRVRATEPGASAAAMAAIDAAVKAGGRIIIHCWGGGGRAGRVAAAWLVHAHGRSFAAAAAEVNGADATSLEAFMAAPPATPAPPPATSAVTVDDDTRWKPFRLPRGAPADWVSALELDAASTFAPLAQPPHPPRFLVLHGSLRTTSYSRLLCYEFARVLERLGGDVRCFDPRGLPPHDVERDAAHPKVTELRSLSEWSEGQLWVSPEQHGAITGLMKSQIDWIPLSLGSVRPTQGRTLAVAEVSGGSQSFNAVNTLRLLGRWMRMITIPNQSSVPMAWTQFDGDGRMKPSDLRSRVVDVAEELYRFTMLTRPVAAALVDRFSEREEVRAKGRLLSQAEKVAGAATPATASTAATV